MRHHLVTPPVFKHPHREETFILIRYAKKKKKYFPFTDYRNISRSPFFLFADLMSIRHKSEILVIIFHL